MKKMISSELRVDRKPLIKVKKRGKKKEQLVLILLGNQTTIIDTEKEAMKKFRKYHEKKTYIVDMFDTNKRLIAQTSSLSNLIDNLNQYDSSKKS